MAHDDIDLFIYKYIEGRHIINDVSSMKYNIPNVLQHNIRIIFG